MSKHRLPAITLAFASFFILFSTGWCLVLAQDETHMATESPNEELPPEQLPNQSYGRDDFIPILKETWEILRELGFKPGPFNAYLGLEMQNAVKKFQQDNGLAETGRVTPKLVLELKKSVADSKEVKELGARLQKLYELAVHEPDKFEAYVKVRPVRKGDQFGSCLGRLEQRLEITGQEQIAKCWEEGKDEAGIESCQTKQPELQLWLWASALRLLLENDYRWERTTSGGQIIQLHARCESGGEEGACKNLNRLRGPTFKESSKAIWCGVRLLTPELLAELSDLVDKLADGDAERHNSNPVDDPLANEFVADLDEPTNDQEHRKHLKFRIFKGNQTAQVLNDWKERLAEPSQKPVSSAPVESQ